MAKSCLVFKERERKGGTGTTVRDKQYVLQIRSTPPDVLFYRKNFVRIKNCKSHAAPSHHSSSGWFL